MNIEQVVRMIYETDSLHAQRTCTQVPVYLIKGAGAAKWLEERRSSNFYGTKERLEWSLLYFLGCNPAEVRRTWEGMYALPFGSGAHTTAIETWMNHPLNIASLMLLEGRHHDASIVLDEYRLLRKHWKYHRSTAVDPFPHGLFPNHLSNNEWASQPICPIDPRDHGLDTFDFEPKMDKIGFALWYEKDRLKERFETIRYSHHLRMLRSLVEATGEEWRRLVAARVGVYLRKEMRASRTSYEEVAYAIRVTGKQRATKILHETTRCSTRAAFALLPWADSEEMKMALTEVAKLGESSREEVLRRLGRPPTVEELLSIRNKGLVDLLFLMPWEFLEPAATGADKAKLVARMAKYFKTRDLDVIQNVLVPHEKRLSAVEMPDPLPEGVEAPSPYETAWGQMAEQVEQARVYNMELRMRLFHIADEDQYAAILLALVAARRDNHTITSLMPPAVMDIASELPGYDIVASDPESFRPKLSV